MNAQQQLDQVLALAALFQAVALVQQVARGLPFDARAAQASLESVFALDPETVESIFGGREQLRLGLEVLGRQIGNGPGQRDLELTRYAANVLHLERRLARRQPQMLEALRSGLEDLGHRRAARAASDADIVAELDELYQRTVSTIGPRIVVTGEPELLQVDANAQRVRALLLAAIRAAVLWRQLGGSRWRLLLARRRMVAFAEALRGEIEAGSSAER